MTPWLFDRRTDLWAFGGSAALSVALFLLLHAVGLADAATPPWAFLLLVVGVDVAHVWSTIYRVYLDTEELARRRMLYVGVPLITYAVGVVLHWQGSHVFWRALAYLAVFHFVRQQYGWVMWYRRNAREPLGARLRVDQVAIYAATLGPLLWWHSRLPLPFHWFVKDDFVPGLPTWVGDVALGLEALCLVVYGLAHAHARGAQPWGKHLVVGSPALCWFLSIVLAGGDLAFTVVNVLPHGIPYLVLCRRYARGRARSTGEGGGVAAALMRGGVAVYLGSVVALAYVEEAVWEWTIWHDHPSLFGELTLDVATSWHALLVPLLSLPQASHYVLDGFIWRGGPRNPLLAPALAPHVDAGGAVASGGRTG
ncbi:MAG: hypothetical protein AB2A00_20550 [Myxococcota bacterium]